MALSQDLFDDSTNGIIHKSLVADDVLLNNYHMLLPICMMIWPGTMITCRYAW